MDAKLKDIAEYIVIAIHEFAKQHQFGKKSKPTAPESL